MRRCRAVHALLPPLLIARLAHPFGMLAPEASAQHDVCRGGGAIVTVRILGIAAARRLLRGVP